MNEGFYFQISIDPLFPTGYFPSHLDWYSVVFSASFDLTFAEPSVWLPFLHSGTLFPVGDASLLGGRCDTACLVEPDFTRTLISSRSDAVCLCCRYSSVCPSAGAASGRYRKILRFVRRRIKYQGSVMYEPYFPAASIRLTVLVCHVRIVKFTRIASPKLPLLLPLLRSRSRFSGGSNCGIGTRSFFQLSP